MNKRRNDNNSFWEYVFSNKRYSNRLQTIVILYFTSEILINEICQRINEICQRTAKIRYVVIVIMLISLLWIFFIVIGNYLKDSENKSLWIHVFSDRKNVFILQIPLISCLLSEIINVVTIFMVTLIVLTIIFFNAIKLYYTSKSDNNESLPVKKVSHFSRTFSETEQKKLFEGLKGGYLSDDTDFSAFCHVFRTSDYIDTMEEFYGLKWIKTTTRSKQRHVRSLLDLLLLLEIPESEIKDLKLLNKIFHTGTVIRSNNLTDVTDGKHNLKPFKSEFHEELVKIVNQSKEK